MRRPGFYWVQYLGEMTLGQWDDKTNEWYLIGLEKGCNYIEDSDLDYIAQQVG